MKSHLGYWIWAACCTGITVMVVFQTAAIFGDRAQLDQVAAYMICDTQKLLFNNMLYFSALIYLDRKNYMDEHVILRCRNQAIELTLYMNFHGIILCIIFVLMQLIGIFLSAAFVGIKTCITLHMILSFVLSAVFAFSWYMIYSVAYIISKKHIVGFFALVISQLVILVTHLFLQFMCDIDISKYLLNFIYPLIVIAFTEIIQILLLKKREWY